MNKHQFYDKLGEKKYDLRPYGGGNKRIDIAVQWIRENKLSGNILDVGCANGDLLYSVQDQFALLSGCDISENMIQATIKKVGKKSLNKIDITCMDVDKETIISFKDTFFDVITCLDVIEHLFDPDSFLKKAYRILKPNGKLFIVTPNIQYYKRIMELLVGHFPNTSGDKEVRDGGHVNFFTIKDLLNCMKSAGFSKIQNIIKEKDGDVRSWLTTYDNYDNFACPYIVMIGEK